MDQMVWWVLVVQLGVAGSMATIGSLNVQWWSQDRSERVLGLTGVLCWSVAFALILGAVGLAFPELTVWQVIVPVRAVLIGAIVALLLATLSAVVPLPGARAAFVTSVAVPVVFVGVGLTGDRAYIFVGGSPWPVFQPLGKVHTVDVLADPEVREGIKEYSKWPTIPQVYIHGSFVGGSDIVADLAARGELKTMVERGPAPA